MTEIFLEVAYELAGLRFPEWLVLFAFNSAGTGYNGPARPILCPSRQDDDAASRALRHLVARRPRPVAGGSNDMGFVGTTLQRRWKSRHLWRNSAGDVDMWLMDGFSITSGTTIANIWTGWAIVGTGYLRECVDIVHGWNHIS